jgi:hypothetical protein
METEEARRLWIEANHAEVLGDLDGASNLLRRIVVLHPNSALALDAAYYLRTGRRIDPRRIEPTMEGPGEDQITKGERPG